MKISQKQASLLANEVVKQLRSKKVDKVPDAVKEQLKTWNEKRRVLNNEKADVQEKINRHENALDKITGNLRNVYASDSITRIIEKMEEKCIPKVSEIEDEIILSAMFASEDDMQTFINKIVTKYSKKIQSKVLSN